MSLRLQHTIICYLEGHLKQTFKEYVVVRKRGRPATTDFDEYLLFEWPFVFREKFVTLTPQTFVQQPRFIFKKKGGDYAKKRF